MLHVGKLCSHYAHVCFAAAYSCFDKRENIREQKEIKLLLLPNGRQLIYLMGSSLCLKKTKFK